MSGISVSGLVSGSFNWQTIVDQLIQIDSAPITRLANQQTTNNNQLASLSKIQTELTALQTSTQTLSNSSVFSARTAASATVGSSWTATATGSAPIGSYAIAVTNLAAAAQLNGAAGISTGLSPINDVSAVTLASMPTAQAPTAGTFTVNGKTVTVALTDSLQAVFGKISTATGGTVTASYSAATDMVTLATTNASPVVLGAANDTSNLVSVLRLTNNGTSSTTSSATLGRAALTAPLTSSRLRGSLAGVDGMGNGAFTVNGVSVSYNVNTDSLSAVLARITASTAGVTASYDSTADRVVLTNNVTGDIGIGAADTTGNLLGALSLTTAATLARGKNALFTVNGGGTLTSASNALDGTLFGAAGLKVNVNTTGTQTVVVAPDTAGMTTAINSFITAFNAVQNDVVTQTQITKAADGTPLVPALSGSRDVSAWSRQLTNLAFSQISGLSGTIKQLADLGIDFDTTATTISITNQAKFNAALNNVPTDVGAYFNTAATQFNTYLGNVLAVNGSLASDTATLNKSNTDITAQIATLNTRLADERTQLTNAFIAMQKAQSNAQSQQATLTGMFSTSTTAS